MQFARDMHLSQKNTDEFAIVAKNDAALKSLGEKSCEIKGSFQEMVAMMLILINLHSHY